MTYQKILSQLDLIYHGEDTNYLYVLNWIIYLLITKTLYVGPKRGKSVIGIFCADPSHMIYD